MRLQGREVVLPVLLLVLLAVLRVVLWQALPPVLLMLQ
jgi:hypothetical protein